MKQKKTKNFLAKTHEMNTIKTVISVVSGKGGVGKSLVTSMLAVLLRRQGYRVGIMDADMTGPSIPMMFGVSDVKPDHTDTGLFPVHTKNDILLMSMNLLLEKTDSPVIWRGPLISNTVKQFWTHVIWGKLDYLLIDMPPGTGDVPLTVFQTIPLDGIVIVTSPQDLVSLIVKKAYHMAKSMDIPILGIVENMSHVVCPNCGETFHVFGKSRAEEVAQSMGIPLLGRIPIHPKFAEQCDRGEMEKIDDHFIDECVERLLNVILQKTTNDADH